MDNRPATTGIAFRKNGHTNTREVPLRNNYMPAEKPPLHAKSAISRTANMSNLSDCEVASNVANSSKKPSLLVTAGLSLFHPDDPRLKNSTPITHKNPLK